MTMNKDEAQAKLAPLLEQIHALIEKADVHSAMVVLTETFEASERRHQNHVGTLEGGCMDCLVGSIASEVYGWPPEYRMKFTKLLIGMLEEHREDVISDTLKSIEKASGTIAKPKAGH